MPYEPRPDAGWQLPRQRGCTGAPGAFLSLAYVSPFSHFVEVSVQLESFLPSGEAQEGCQVGREANRRLLFAQAFLGEF